jgi:hypothetical protein
VARYLVFGRKDYAQPLRQQGLLEAHDGPLAQELALRHYGREWVELVLIPEAAVRWVFRRQEGPEEGEEG